MIRTSNDENTYIYINLYLAVYIYVYICIYIPVSDDCHPTFDSFPRLSCAASPLLPHGQPLRPFACGRIIQVPPTGMVLWKEHDSHCVLVWMD